MARRPDDIMLPALRKMLGVIAGPGGVPGRGEVTVVGAAREIIGEQGHSHFVAIADAWLAEHRPAVGERPGEKSRRNVGDGDR